MAILDVLEPVLGFGIPALIVGPFLWRMLRGAQKNRRLESEGIRTEGTIVSLERTGVSINDQPEVKFTMRYEVPGRGTITGTATRVIDILELPDLRPGVVLPIRYDSENPTSCIFEKQEASKPTEAVSGTAATFDSPLWLFGTKGAEEWLLPREPSRNAVVIIDFTDPHDGSGGNDREWLIDSAAFLICEALWMRTDAPAAAAVLINLEHKKILQPTGALAPYADLAGFTKTLDKPTTIAWGAAMKDIDREGLLMKVRVTTEESERTFVAPLFELAGTFIDWLVSRNLAARKDPPAFYALPKNPEHHSLYAFLFHNLQLQLLADKKNAAINPLDADMHDKLVDFAQDAVNVLEGAGEQVKVFLAIAAGYAHRAGCLKDERRKAAIDTILTIVDPDLRRIVPRLYARMGERAKAEEAQAKLAGSPYRGGDDAAYRAWLEKLYDD